MDTQDQILLFIKANGPILPSKVAKAIKTDILIASAHLSDLSSQNKLKISKLKVGGSPLYYLPGQDEQLFRFAQGNVNPKDYLVLERLKSKKVMREADLDLLSKVALRHLKDFAIPLQVRTKEKTELFWKWYLLDPEQTNTLISRHLQPVPIPLATLSQKQESSKSKPTQEEMQQPPPSSKTPSYTNQTATEQSKEEHLQKKQEIKSNMVPRVVQEQEEPKEKIQKIIKSEKIKEIQQREPVVKQQRPKPSSSDPREDIPRRKQDVKKTVKPKKKVEKQPTLQELQEEKIAKEQEKLEKAEKKKKEIEEEERDEISSALIQSIKKERERKEIEQEAQEIVSMVSKSEKQQKLEDKKPLLQKLKEKIAKPKATMPDPLLLKVEGYARELNITIEEKEIIRKGKEIDLLLYIPCVVGRVKFYCKARSKNKCDEKDLSSAFMRARVKKLPLLFLYTNEVNKKAREMLDTGTFDNIMMKRID